MRWQLGEFQLPSRWWLQPFLCANQNLLSAAAFDQSALSCSHTLAHTQSVQTAGASRYRTRRPCSTDRREADSEMQMTLHSGKHWGTKRCICLRFDGVMWQEDKRRRSVRLWWETSCWGPRLSPGSDEQARRAFPSQTLWQSEPHWEPDSHEPGLWSRSEVIGWPISSLCFSLLAETIWLMLDSLMFEVYVRPLNERVNAFNTKLPTWSFSSHIFS